MAGLVPAIHVFPCITWMPGTRPGITPSEGSRCARRVLAERRLGGGEPCDRHPERRARHIVEAGFVTERHRRRIAAVFAADAKLQALARLTAALGGDLDELADPLTVKRDERVGHQNPA